MIPWCKNDYILFEFLIFWREFQASNITLKFKLVSSISRYMIKLISNMMDRRLQDFKISAKIALEVINFKELTILMFSICCMLVWCFNLYLKSIFVKNKASMIHQVSTIVSIQGFSNLMSVKISNAYYLPKYWNTGSSIVEEKLLAIWL